MRMAYLIIVLLPYLVTITSLHCAQEPQSCYIYPTKLYADDLVVTRQAAEELSEGIHSPPPNGTLILVPAGDDFYHYAISYHQFVDGKSLYVLNLKKNLYEIHTTDKTKILKFIPRLIYQPHPPKDFFIQSFHALVDRFSHEQEPYLTAKIIPPEKHIIVIGDLHGDSRALRHILCDLYNINALGINGILSPETLIVFTGDLTDRGPKGAEVWDIALELKNLNPKQVFILKGNHETVHVARYGNFLLQLEDLTDCDEEYILSSLKKLFSQLPLCLLLGIAPQPRKDAPETPYRFLMFCHGGIDPLIRIKRLIQTLIQKHKQCNQDTMSLPAVHHNPDFSGLLWTDFRANFYDDEPSTRMPSSRGAELHLFNTSAAMDFFDEHTSEHPHHPYILDGLIRGHQHLGGIGRLRIQADSGQDWVPLESQETEIIQQASIYTCTASTKWVCDRSFYSVSYADIGFNEDTRQWTFTPYIASCPKKQ